MAELFPPSLDEQIECVTREIGMRRAVYPGMVTARRMSQEKADREIAAMEEVARSLHWLKRQGAKRSQVERI